MEDEELGLGGKLDFLEAFSALPDPRQSKKVLYPLDEVLLLTLCAVLCGADGWVSVALFGEQKLKFLRRFLPFENGTPSHDQLGLIFGALDAQAFQTCFIAWTQASSGAIAGVVAIDGKTVRRSFDRAGNKGAIHLVSAWSSRQKLVLGARAVDEKSNEITAIPELLDLLAIKGAIVTIDAMGCQKKIAEKIIAKSADYVFGLKGNQATLRTDVEDLFTEQMACNFKDVAVSRAIGTDAGHGRIETREVFAVGDIAWLRQNHEWAGLRFIIMGSPAGKHKRALSGNGASTSPRCPPTPKNSGPPSVNIGAWRMLCIGSWTSISGTMTAASERKTPPPTSHPSSAQPSMPCARHPARTASNPSVLSPLGTKTISPKSSKTYECNSFDSPAQGSCCS